MKKTLIILLALLCLFTTACNKKEKTNEDEETINTSKEVDKYLITLSFEELQKKIDNKDTFILVITQTNCSHCAEYKPVLKSTLAKYNVYAYEIEENLLNTEDYGKLKDIANASGTPTTVFIEDGEEKSTATRIVGSAKQSKIVSRLKQFGYIKE